MSEAKAAKVHPMIVHQQVGGEFEGVYYVDQAYIKQTSTKKDYTDMMLRDRSGARPVKFWGVVKGIERGVFALVRARVETYNGSPSIIAGELCLAETPESTENYMAEVENRGEVEAQLFAAVHLVGEMEKGCPAEDGTVDQSCSLLLGDVFDSQAAFHEKFVQSPGGTQPFYGRCGGLLYNTVRLAHGAVSLSKLHGLTQREASVAVTSALLCRIGAVDAYGFAGMLPEATRRGILLGCGNLTMARLYTVIRRVSAAAKESGTPVSQDVFLRVLHCVSSCESVSTRPMTREAITLESVVRSDANAVQAFDFIANDQNEGEEFTAYDPKTGRRYYRGA